MIDLWTRGLEPQLAIDIRQNFKEALITRKRLIQILNDKIDEIRKVSSNKAQYDSPNWALHQADVIGQERSIRFLIDLIKD